MNYDKVSRSGITYFRYRHWDPILRKHVKTIYDRTLKGLKVKVEDYQTRHINDIEDVTQTFGKFCKNWLYNIHFVDKKPNTQARYDSTFTRYIQNSRLSLISMNKLSVTDLQEWFNELANSYSINRVYEVKKIISPCIRYAFKTRVIPANYMDLIILPNKTSKISNGNKVHPLTLNQQKELLSLIHGTDIEALVVTALDTGMRQGELFALTWKDVNFINMEINIDKNYSYAKDISTGKYKSFVGLPKTICSIRRIPLPKHTKEVLQSHKQKQEKLLSSSPVYQNENNLVFCTPIGTYLDSSNILKKLKEYYAKLDIFDKTFHDLRHTYATRLFELGESPKTVQILMGHSDVTETLNTYTHVLERLKKKTASKIDQLYETDS